MNVVPHRRAGSAASETANAAPRAGSSEARRTDGHRVRALDFTKGSLVLFMVLYHWLNYFIGLQSDLYKYLRFLTPSFIFITGFLISSIYLPRYRSGDSRPPKRIAARGFKLLSLFFGMNFVVSLLLSQSYNGKIVFEPFSLSSIMSVYVTGDPLIAGQGKAAVFYILLPIAYLLLLSAWLLRLSRRFPYVFHVVCLLCTSGSLILSTVGIQSANLELVTIGLVGVIAGHISIDKINSFVSHRHMLVLAYVCYTAVITFVPVGYILQIISVLLNLMLLYVIGLGSEENRKVQTSFILLGEYSLFGYIVQIAILQVLYRVLRHGDTATAMLGLALVATVALTLLSVMVLDWARAKTPQLDALYRAVFL